MSNIHTLNDLRNNNNNNNNNNNQINNNQLYNNNNNNNDNIQSFFSDFFPSSIYNMKALTFVLICLLIIIYILQVIAYFIFFKQNWTCAIYKFGATEINAIIGSYQYHRLLTSIFIHHNFFHLLTNIISLFFLGFYVEYLINNKTYYILLYIISGLYGNLISLLLSPNDISLGASGSIVGLCGYFFIYFILNYNNIQRQEKFFFAIFFLIMIMNLLSGFSSGSSVDVWSHLGGLLTGFFISLIIMKKSNLGYRYNEKIITYIYYFGFFYLGIIPILDIIFLFGKKYYNISNSLCYSLYK